MPLPESFDVPILQDCFDAYRQGATEITLPITRVAGSIHGLFTESERARFRAVCLDGGKARAFGLKVEFV